MVDKQKAIWVFGDYRNYFQNRVTLQLLARSRELAEPLNAEVCALVFGHDVDEWVGEYMAHGADRIYMVEDESLKDYPLETYVNLTVKLAGQYGPEIILAGATGFGREYMPRVASRLGAGLTADCVGLDIDDNGLLVQTAPAFGGNLLAEMVMPGRLPQMATVRPGVFAELPHDYEAEGEVIRIPLPDDLPPERVRLVKSRRLPRREEDLENASVVVTGGRGMGSKKKFAKLHELAGLLGGEVGATRPVVYAQWIDHEAMVGQAGKTIKPRVLISFGASGAIQHTAGIINPDFIIAVNKNPSASMMKMADVAIEGDANQVALALIKELKNRLGE